MTAHSHIGASSAYRWTNCPGSVKAAQSAPPQPESEFAQLGTAAHALAERCLRTGHDAEVFDRQYVVKKPAVEPTIMRAPQSDAEWYFLIDDDMTQAVQVYLYAVRGEILAARTLDPDNTVVSVEQSFNLDNLYKGMFGTNDALVYTPSKKRLAVFDYKHGQGVAVEVENNLQLQYYALGALLSHDWPIEEIVIVIAQPRCPHPKGAVRYWRVDTADLMEVADDLVKAAQLAESDDPPFAAGDWCKWCPASLTCETLANFNYETARAEFTPMDDGAEAVLVDDPAQLDSDQLGRILRRADILKDWISRVHDFANQEAHHGRVPTGYKLVKKRAQRKWKNEEEIVEFMGDLGFGKDQTHAEPKLKGPAQMEKLLPAKERSSLEAFWSKESSGATLAPEEDERPAAKPDVETEFTKVEE